MFTQFRTRLAAWILPESEVETELHRLKVLAEIPRDTASELAALIVIESADPTLVDALAAALAERHSQQMLIAHVAEVHTGEYLPDPRPYSRLREADFWEEALSGPATAPFDPFTD